MSGIKLSIPAYKRGSISLVAAALVTLVMSLGLAKGPVEKANALPLGNHAFCSDWWLQPFGRSGDRCAAGHNHWGRIMSVTIRTYTRAGCVNYEGWYGELYQSWNCYGNETYGSIYVPNDGGSYDGIIRNNNLSYTGKFGGAYSCCYLPQ